MIKFNLYENHINIPKIPKIIFNTLLLFICK